MASPDPMINLQDLTHATLPRNYARRVPKVTAHVPVAASPDVVHLACLPLLPQESEHLRQQRAVAVLAALGLGARSMRSSSLSILLLRPANPSWTTGVSTSISSSSVFFLSL